MYPGIKITCLLWHAVSEPGNMSYRMAYYVAYGVACIGAVLHVSMAQGFVGDVDYDEVIDGLGKGQAPRKGATKGKRVGEKPSPGQKRVYKNAKYGTMAVCG